MFEGFASVWTPIVAAREVGDRPVSVQVAGAPLVLFRDKGGRVGALLDRCPHRGVKLSLGEVNEDGCLACPFHGWAFRADGACDHVPFNPMSEEKRARYAATALPAREVAGMVWVFTGRDPAGSEPEPPPALVEPGWYRHVYHQDWDIHWTRAMENMLDMPHLPFIHRRTIGRGMRKKLRKDSVMELALEPTPYGAQIRSRFDDEPEDSALRWRRPNAMELHIQPERFRIHVYCVPLGGNRTRMILASARKFMSFGPLAAIMDYANRKILFEDRAVVESSSPPEVPPAGDELSVATDGPTLHFRRYYHRELRGSSADLVPASRLARREADAQGGGPIAAE